MKGAILAADGVLPPDGAVPPPWPARRVLIDGAMLHVRDTPATAPDAEPAVYVHGLGGSSQNWTDVAALLADRFDGQAVDLPGFGYSDPSRRYSIPAFAARYGNGRSWISNTPGAGPSTWSAIRWAAPSRYASPPCVPTSSRPSP